MSLLSSRALSRHELFYPAVVPVYPSDIITLVSHLDSHTFSPQNPKRVIPAYRFRIEFAITSPRTTHHVRLVHVHRATFAPSRDKGLVNPKEVAVDVFYRASVTRYGNPDLPQGKVFVGGPSCLIVGARTETEVDSSDINVKGARRTASQEK